MSGFGRRARLVLGLAVTVALTVSMSRVEAATTPSPRPFVDAGGIHVVSVTRLDGRDINVKTLSASLRRAVDVRILLPSGYDEHPLARYPVLYLFHGTSGRASDWVSMGGAEATTAGLPLITVMPDAGFNGDGGGWFTNWVDTTTTLGPSQWETFHVAQLIPWVDANLRTIALRRGRAIAGLSQGGFGAMTYAARHPDLFAAAASFSGAPEIDRDADVIAGSTAVIEATAMGLDGVEPDAMFGSRATDEINWQGHDPSTLMTNLRGMALYMWTATGQPGPYDTAPNPSASGIELLTHESTQRFHDHLVAAGIPSYYDDYVYGTHTWAYWARDLRQFVGPMMATFAHPSTPSVVSYESIDRQWTQWGWSVALIRPAPQEFSRLGQASARGFTLEGSGRATVTTPAAYRPGSTATVRLSDASGVHTDRITVPPTGRLSIAVVLGSGDHTAAVRITT
jgi:S-formylglutathione hydrolase FrmB